MDEYTTPINDETDFDAADEQTESSINLTSIAIGAVATIGGFFAGRWIVGKVADHLTAKAEKQIAEMEKYNTNDSTEN